MKTLSNHRQIFISVRLWDQVKPNIDLNPFIHALQEIDLSEYGEGLMRFHFSFLVVRPYNNYLYPYTYYDRKKQEADISVQIPYTQILEASKEEIIKLMEKAYLEGIEELKNLSLRYSFDSDLLKERVQAIFARDRWYELAEAA